MARDDADILRRGLAAFAELGYQGTTVRELAKRLGVSHNYVNDRYGSKEQFWRAVVDFGMADHVADLMASFEHADDVDVLRAVVTRWFTLAAGTPEANRIIAEESVRDSTRLDYLAERYTRRFWDELTPVIQRLMDSGRMPQVPLLLVFVALNGPALALTHQNMHNRLGPAVPDTDEGRIRMAEQLARLVVEGLVPSGPGREETPARTSPDS